MSPDACEILPGALLIGDAHYSERRPALLSFLNAVESGRIAAPQLILMGDIFDLLFGQIGVTHEMNREAVACLRRISERLPVLYLEGNHDYNLSALFPAATVVPIAKHPYRCRCGNTPVFLAHGDIAQPPGYRIYTALIRHGAVLRFLGAVNRLSGGGVIARLEAHLEKKNDCYRIPDFERRTGTRLASLNLPPESVCFEGHYHQGRSFETGGIRYFNLPAFACNRHYAIVTCDEGTFGLEERAWKGEA